MTKTSGTYDTAGAGTSKTVTVSLTNSDYAAVGATLLSNYTLPTAVTGAIGTVSKAPLTVTARPDAKTYDGLPYAGGNGVDYRGLVNSEAASVLGGTLVFGGSSQGAINAGQYGISAGGLTSPNYAIEYRGSTLTVKPKAVSVTGLIADNKEFDGTRNAVILNWGAAATGVGSETLELNHGSASFSDAIVGTGKTVTADGYSLANGTQGGLASNYVLTSTSAQTLANIVVGERAQTVADVQSSLNTSTLSLTGTPGSAVPGTGIGQSAEPLVSLMDRDTALDAAVITANGQRIDGSNPDGSPASQDVVQQSSAGGPAGSTRVAGQTATAGPAAANRVGGQATATGPNPRGSSTGLAGGVVGGAAGSTVNGGSSPTAAPAGTSSFRTSGLSSMPAPVPAAPVPGTAPRVSQDVFVKGFSRAVEVGTTTGGAVILATVAASDNLTRLGVTVAAGDGFGIAIPLDLFGPAAAARGAAGVQATTSSGAALPAWLSFDRSSMRLGADNVPLSGLPLTVKLAAGPGKTVEVTLK